MRDLRSAALEAESFELKCGALWVMDNGTETMSLLFCLLAPGFLYETSPGRNSEPQNFEGSFHLTESFFSK